LLYLFDNYALDTDRRELRCGAAALAIEPQVFDLLEHLIRHRERVVSRDELIESVWGGRIVSESALSTRINAVRSAIGDSGTVQRLIKTLPRKGLRFVGDVREEHKAPEQTPAGPLDDDASHCADEVEADGKMPARLVDAHSAAPPLDILVPVTPRRRLSRASAGILGAIGILCLGALVWSYVARSERNSANVETATRVSELAERINMNSRENYEAVRALDQWAIALDPNNGTALTRLTFAMTTGVLNHWSDDVVADLHTADLTLREAIRVAPGSTKVRGAQCHILRAMRQFEIAIKVCGEIARSSPNDPFLHKEIGYNKLMLGLLDEAMAEFLEADRIAPDSRLRWSWNQGIGLIYLMQGQDQKAIARLWRASLEAPNAGHPVAYLASAYALVGREQEARDTLEHYVRLWPKTSLNNFGPMVGTAAFNTRMERVREGLRLAGLAE
jgi:DNA-binding winged helix-turn-helix (wHTH) protein/tetratricopeptide (TPR) repeat protein